MPDDPYPRASLTLSDISGVKPARQLTMRERVTRETPMCAANSLTVIGMFSKASLRISLGWGDGRKLDFVATRGRTVPHGSFHFATILRKLRWESWVPRVDDSHGWRKGDAGLVRRKTHDISEPRIT